MSEHTAENTCANCAFMDDGQPCEYHLGYQAGLAQTAKKGVSTRAHQIATTAVPVACTDVGIYKAFMPSVLSDSVVIAKADLTWLLRAIPSAKAGDQ